MPRNGVIMCFKEDTSRNRCIMCIHATRTASLQILKLLNLIYKIIYSDFLRLYNSIEFLQLLSVEYLMPTYY